MDELTLDEYNFLRWLLDKNISEEPQGKEVAIAVGLTDYQKQLLDSIKSKLKGLSSY